MRSIRSCPPLTQRHIEKFWQRVSVIDDDDSCWEWTGPTVTAGYGVVSVMVDGKQQNHVASRIAFLLQHGYWPEAFVCHRCDNPRCVRGNHLFEGTHAENMEDMRKKGRWTPARGLRNGAHTHPDRRPRGDRSAVRLHPEIIRRGSENGNSRLTDEQVRAIRRQIAEGRRLDDIASEFHIARSTVSAIKAGRLWGWLDVA